MQNLLLYRPLLSNKITQKFGANRACVYPNGKVVGKRSVTCPAGSRPFYKSMGMEGHNGTDYRAIHGEKIFHAGDYAGRMKIEKDFSGGIGVDIVSLNKIKVGDYEGYIKTRYWHLKSPVGHDGKEVRLGDVIGLANSTGASSGTHLHFGVKKCDKKGRPLESNNGFNGAFDHSPYQDNSTDAKSAAEFLNQPPQELTPQEQKEMNNLLSLYRQLLNLLMELKRKL